MEMMLNVNIWRHGCLLGAENICVGLGKGCVLVGDCCTFELVLVTYTPCSENHQRRQNFLSVRIPESLCSQMCSPKTVELLHHWLNFIPDNNHGVCYGFLFIFSSCFSPLLFLIFWFSLTGTQEFLPP